LSRGEANSAKDRCPSKHEYTEANTILYEYKPGLFKRVCRECARINGRVQRLKRYGLTLESYEAMLAGQDYRCKLCRSEFKNSRDENIDHDHACCDRDGSCGKCIRGILCGECNRGLARFKDSAALLVRASDYLLGRLHET
jgi:Recombination endonuclease VII